MASRPVPPKYLIVGQEYLDALTSLGLIPAYLGWGWEPKDGKWLLVLVTSIVEAGGPLALNRLLFRAYNGKATPKQISPFIVRVFSPEVVAHAGGRDFWLLGEKQLMVNPVPGKSNSQARPAKVLNSEKTFMGLDLEQINSYQTIPHAVDRALAGYHQRQRDWLRFKRNVERLAA